MDTEEVLGDGAEPRLVTNPLPPLLGGLGLVISAYLLAVTVTAWMSLWFVLLVIGLISLGAAVVRAPHSPVVLGAAALGALLASLAADASAVSAPARGLFFILACVAALAAVLVVLPRVVGQVVVSLVILFHFTGILTAVMSAPPQSWVAGQLWTYVYRPYLEFMYLNNAYHFYSPEPGSACLLWFRVEYEPDGDKVYTRWVKVPDLEDDGKPIDFDALERPRRLPWVQYTRRLSLVEGVRQTANPPSNYALLENNRRIAGQAMGIPFHPGRPPSLQYREPNVLSRQWLRCYARHVARTYKHKDRPDKAVVGVKVYLVDHEIIHNPEEVARGRSLYDPTLYFPYYMGEYDADGNMKPSSQRLEFDESGKLVERGRDPFLFWLIPYVAVTEPKAGPPDQAPRVLDYLSKHAGDPPPAPTEVKP